MNTKNSFSEIVSKMDVLKVHKYLLNCNKSSKLRTFSWFGFVASRGKSTFFLHIFFCISMHWHKIRNFILVNLIYRAKRDVLEMISFLPYILINLIDIPKIPCQNIFKKWCCNNFFEGKNQLCQLDLQTKNYLPKKLLERYRKLQ